MGADGGGMTAPAAAKQRAELVLFCRSCHHDLEPLASGKCGKCGSPFRVLCGGCGKAFRGCEQGRAKFHAHACRRPSPAASSASRPPRPPPPQPPTFVSERDLFCGRAIDAAAVDVEAAGDLKKTLAVGAGDLFKGPATVVAEEASAVDAQRVLAERWQQQPQQQQPQRAAAAALRRPRWAAASRGTLDAFGSVVFLTAVTQMLLVSFCCTASGAWLVMRVLWRVVVARSGPGSAAAEDFALLSAWPGWSHVADAVEVAGAFGLGAAVWAVFAARERAGGFGKTVALVPATATAGAAAVFRLYLRSYMLFLVSPAVLPAAVACARFLDARCHERAVGILGAPQAKQQHCLAVPKPQIIDETLRRCHYS